MTLEEDTNSDYLEESMKQYYVDYSSLKFSQKDSHKMHVGFFWMIAIFVSAFMIAITLEWLRKRT